MCSSKCDSGFTASSGSFMDPGTCNVCGASCLLGQKVKNLVMLMLRTRRRFFDSLTLHD